jgi:hypothetical protein
VEPVTDYVGKSLFLHLGILAISNNLIFSIFSLMNEIRVQKDYAASGLFAILNIFNTVLDSDKLYEF